MAARIKKDDNVIVISGKDKGKTGKVVKVLNSSNRAIVSGINKVIVHKKQSEGSAGGRISKEQSIHCSNLLHADPKDGSPTRVGFKILENGDKVRFAKKSGEVIDNK